MLHQYTIENISEIVDEMHIHDFQEELIERHIASKDAFEDWLKRFPNNRKQPVLELIVDLLITGRTLVLIDIMLLNGLDALVSKLYLHGKKEDSEVTDNNIMQGMNSLLIK